MLSVNTEAHSLIHSGPTWFSLSSVTLGALLSVGPGWKSSTLVAALLCNTGQQEARSPQQSIA
jgi:hypothetical protein